MKMMRVSRQFVGRSVWKDHFWIKQKERILKMATQMENQLNGASLLCEAVELIKEFVTLGGTYGGLSRRDGDGLNTVEAIYDPYHSWGGFHGIYQAYGRRHVFIRDNGHLYIEPNHPLDLDSPNSPRQALEWVRQMISSATDA